MEENAESHLAYGIVLFLCDLKSPCVKNLFYEGFPYCVIVVDIACSCLIGFVWILELYFAFTGGTEMSSSLVLFRGEALLVCPLVIPYTGRTISVSLLVLTRAHPD